VVIPERWTIVAGEEETPTPSQAIRGEQLEDWSRTNAGVGNHLQTMNSPVEISLGRGNKFPMTIRQPY
jgi:hypothetical protein